MSYTYINSDGVEILVPEITEYLIDYLDVVFGMDQYSRAVTTEQLQSIHGTRKVVDHLRSMCASQNNPKED